MYPEQTGGITQRRVDINEIEYEKECIKSVKAILVLWKKLVIKLINCN